MFFHYTWHESIETPTGLENIKHGLIPDRSSNSLHSETFLATTIHGFHQSLQHPERFPPTLSNLGSSKGKPCQTTAAEAFVSTEHHHSILLIKLLHKNPHRVIIQTREQKPQCPYSLIKPKFTDMGEHSGCKIWQITSKKKNNDQLLSLIKFQ